MTSKCDIGCIWTWKSLGLFCLGFAELPESVIIFISFTSFGKLPVIISLNSFSELHSFFSFWDSGYTNVNKPSDIVIGPVVFLSSNHFSLLFKEEILY